MKGNSSLYSLLLVMISSSNFFRKTLFHSQQKSKPAQILPLLKKDSITPWQAQEEISQVILGKQKPPQERVKRKAKKKQSSIPKLPSNLLDNQSVQPQPNLKSSPPLQVLKRVPINIKCKVDESRVKKDSTYDSISIRQFLNQQRVQLMRLKDANKQTIESDYQPSHFFINRNCRKARSIDSHNKTLDLRRELLEPLQLYERKSVVAMNPALKKRKPQFYMAIAQKYNPLYEHRYSYN